jgi:hypothetical protein
MKRVAHVKRNLALMLAAVGLAVLVGCSSSWGPTLPAPPAGNTVGAGQSATH